MTATATRPVEPAATGAGRSEVPNPPTGPRTPGTSPLMWAEAALVLLSLAAVVGLGRLVTSWSFLGSVLACTVGAHALAIVARRRRWPAFFVGLSGVVGLIVVLGIVHVPSTTMWGLPTVDTIRELRQQLTDARDAFSGAVPPAPLVPGYVVAWSVAAWIVALTADAAAFRARATFESIVPAGSLFIFASALGTSRYRLPATAAFFAAALLVWLTQRLVGRAGTTRWVAAGRGGTASGTGGGASGPGLGAIARPGAAVALTAVMVAAVIAPHLPGAASKAIINWTNRGDDQSTKFTISPLVDIRTRLVDQSTAEVFTVTSTVPSYWRLTALDDFDGQVWSSNNRYTSIAGSAGGISGAPLAQTQRDDQTFHIAGLVSAWLPAAYRATSVTGISARYNDDSSTLLAEKDTKSGQTFRVTSQVPVLSAGELATASSRVPPAIRSADTALPADFPVRVKDLALQVTANAQGPYEKAIALQNFLRSDQFTYDLSVGKGESNGALVRFLFDTKRGYCEQFAGAFAAMARSIGLPARVAVGFTPGEQTGPNTYRVLGLHGHAWPEVYISGFGWVPFEPTPGRGIPGGQDYTGVQEAQAGPADTSNTTVPGETTTTTVAPGATTTLPAQTAAGGGSTGGGILAKVLLAAAALVLIPTGWVLLLDAGRRLLRRRRRRAAADEADRVVVAWGETMATLDRAGLPRHPSETPDEYARRAVESGLTSTDSITELARATTLAVYAPRPLDHDAGQRADELAGTVDAEVSTSIGRWRRFANRLDPRTLRSAPST